MSTEASQQGGSTSRRILFLSHTLPYPPDGGVWIRTYNVLRELSNAFHVTVLSFERLSTAKQGIDTSSSLDHLRSFVNFELFQLPQKRNRFLYVWNHLRSTALRRVYTRYVYHSDVYRRRLQQLVAAGGFDLVHVDSLDLSDYLDCLGDLPVICTHHNVESALLKRRSTIEGTVFGSAYMQMQAKLMEKEERRWCPRFALNVLCSDVDRRLLESLVPGIQTAVVPNGVNVQEFQAIPRPTAGAIFVGATTWFPNLDALEFFTGDILPVIRRELPDYPVQWIGSATNELQARFRSSGVELVGYVEDVRPYVSSANTFVVPLRAGSGTRLKILMAWSMGRAVVSTSVGCEGLEAKDGVNILIRDDPADFARAVIEVERNAGLRRRLADAGRETAVSMYSWTVVGRAIVSLYEGVIGGGVDADSAS